MFAFRGDDGLVISRYLVLVEYDMRNCISISSPVLPLASTITAQVLSWKHKR